MAFVSLFSCPPNHVLGQNMTDSVLAGEKREDGELEDGEIDDDGVGIEEEKVQTPEPQDAEKDKEKVKNDKAHHSSHKRQKKLKEKRRSKRKRRDRQKSHVSSSGTGSDSYDSDNGHEDKVKGKRNKGSYQSYDDQFVQHEHGIPPRSTKHKNSGSEEKFDYDEEEDFSEGLARYKQAKQMALSNEGKAWPSKEQMKRDHLKGMQKQQFTDPHGRGYGGGGGLGRGHGVPNKNKKQKGKNWYRGRGRGGEQGGDDVAKMEGKEQPGFQKKRPIMSQEFINQHTIEHNGRNICKYFIGGRCIKGDQCKFEHDHVVLEKKKELCKYYVQGYCTKGENCIYMHSEYPCKFFHTGAKCYQGDFCKFSHSPLTEFTEPLLEKILNHSEEEHLGKDELELEDLRKQGIAPLPKPPPGVGLLPTPLAAVSPDGSKKIPSLFEIKVQPTVDLAQKIALRPNFYNSTSPPPGQFQGSTSEDFQADKTLSPTIPHSHSVPPPPASPGSMGVPPFHLPNPDLAQSPSRQPPHQGNLHQMSHQSPNSQVQGVPFQSGSDLQMQTNMPFQATHHMSSEFFKNIFSSQSLGLGEKSQSGFMQDCSGTAESQGGMQDFLPAVQKALLLHLNQNQQDSESHITEGQGPVPPIRDKDESTNWYLCGEKDASCEMGISKTLNRPNEMLKSPQSQSKLQQPGVTYAHLADPRLHKEKTLSNNPQMKADILRHGPDNRNETDAASDLRPTRDPCGINSVEPNSFKPDVHHHPHLNTSTSQKHHAGEEDDEGERELRERAALIPLDPSAGVMLQDPRCQVKQFSHIRVDILLQRPAFAHSVVWAPEDLIPSLIPKQEPSINLPLPPLIADAQMKRSLSSPLDHSSPSALTPSDPHRPAPHLKEGVGKLGSPSKRTLEPRLSAEKPSDPRTNKMLDPRISRAGSLDSKLSAMKDSSSSGGGVMDPRLQRCSARSSSVQSTASAKPDAEMLPPYAPRLASSSGLESPTTLLGSISLYDPRNHAFSRREEVEPPKKAGIFKQPGQLENPGQVAAEKKGKAPDKDLDNWTSGCQSGQPVSTAALSSSPDRTPAPAMHHLPILPVAGLIRPGYTDPQQSKQGGQTAGAEEKEEDPVKEEEEEEEEEEKKDGLLRDVFKTFDPTASPFCQ